MKLQLIAASFLFSAMSVFALPAAALMEALSINTLVQASDSVVRGEVRAMETQWDSSGTQILTVATIRVDQDYMEGVSDELITVVYPGGELDGLIMMVSDSVELTVGEDVIIFLEKDQAISGQPYFVVVGSAQGKYAIGLDGNVQTPRFLLQGEQSSENRQLSEHDLVRQITDALSNQR